MLLVMLFLAASLPGRIAELARPASGQVGAAVMVVETGRMASFHGGSHFPMQSVYKLPIGMAVLHAVDGGALKLDQPLRVAPGDLVPRGIHSPLRDRSPKGNVDVSVRELMRLMISESDGTASDVLMRAAGGPARIAAYLRGLGVRGVMVATTEAEMAATVDVQYRNWATPDSAVRLLKILADGQALKPQSQSFLLDLMTQSTPGPKRIKGLLPPGTPVAHKTGTSDTSPSGVTYATNDIGLVTLPDGKHLAIAVFVAGSKASLEIRERVIASVARAAWEWSEEK